MNRYWVSSRVRRAASDQRIAELQALIALANGGGSSIGHGQFGPFAAYVTTRCLILCYVQLYLMVIVVMSSLAIVFRIDIFLHNLYLHNITIYILKYIVL